MRYKMILLLITVLFASAGNYNPIIPCQVVYAQFGEEITGIVEGINYDTSMILLKTYTNEKMTTYVNHNYYVLRNATIEKDNRKIKLEDLYIGNEIIIHYRITLDGMREIDHIWVKHQ